MKSYCSVRKNRTLLSRHGKVDDCSRPYGIQISGVNVDSGKEPLGVANQKQNRFICGNFRRQISDEWLIPADTTCAIAAKSSQWGSSESISTGLFLFALLMTMGFRSINLVCLLYTSPSPRDQRGSRMPSSA